MPKKITDGQILDATIDTILERGYGGATTREIAERAKISEMTLFRRFSSKERLAIAAVEYLQKKYPSHIAFSGDMSSDLKLILEFFYARTQGRQTRILPLLLMEIPRHPELRELAALPLANVQRVGRLLQRYQEAGVLREEEPISAVIGLIGPLMMTQMLRDVYQVTDKAKLAEMELPSIELDIDHMVERFLNGRRLA